MINSPIYDKYTVKTKNVNNTHNSYKEHKVSQKIETLRKIFI